MIPKDSDHNFERSQKDVQGLLKDFWMISQGFLKDSKGLYRILKDSKDAQEFWRIPNDSEGCGKTLQDSERCLDDF